MITWSGAKTMINTINYTIRYDVAGALIAIAVMLSYFREKKIKTKISDSFTALTWQCFTACLLDITSVYLIKYRSPSNLNEIVNVTETKKDRRKIDYGSYCCIDYRCCFWRFTLSVFPF